ncbi:Coq4 family protein [Candidatus Synechococcus calcipolaris G9]|uniref:Coq4 family protein n=1 Tax=Candidatus Synechococcus calcipolaris G9 TaxID=1497997 RepID=A0ABT6EWN3_9SYNE|nr:Coq4 family protein [Candidatus Synechococcus calcipolaris]MDG2989646.1 Coq4 family protein [Candidatus Synechococcus calcipolaris G9]
MTTPKPNSVDKAFSAFINYLQTNNRIAKAEASDDAAMISFFSLENALDDTELAEIAVAEARKNPEVNALFEERWLPGKLDLNELIKLPEGTLGHVFAADMLAKGFDPDFFHKVPVENDIAYMKMLWRSTHDIYHVVTGFDTDIVGELALQAFMIAQHSIPISIMAYGAGLVETALYSPQDLDRLMQETTRAWDMGTQTPAKFLAQKWDQYLDQPLTAVRDQLGIPKSLQSQHHH